MKPQPQKGRKNAARRTEHGEYSFYPTHFIRGLMAILGAVFVVAVISALFPLPLDHIADPLAGPVPENRILWLLKPAAVLVGVAAGSGLAVGIIALLAILFVFLPVLYRSGKNPVRQRILLAVPFILWLLFLAWSVLLSRGTG